MTTKTTPKTDKFTYRSDYVLLLESHRHLERENAELRESLQSIVNFVGEEIEGDPYGEVTWDQVAKARAILERTK